MNELNIKTSKKEEIIDITSKVESLIKDVKSGLVNIYTQHTTSAIIINENYDPNLKQDILDSLNKLIEPGIWRHDRVDGNASSHIKATILGTSETIPIKNGKLLLGRWQSVAFVELDGPRQRTVIIQIIK